MTAPRGVGKPRRLSEVQETMVAALRSAGFRPKDIAELTGLPLKTLYAVLQRQGLNQSRRRLLTVEEDAEVRNLRTQGWTVKAISERFGVGPDAIASSLKRTEG